ncbi:MAG: EAL domain-containing protein [Lachnospiraceae bacterium]|nr:EAL domain-containing protein [Lachnospiraceae bacterium]
MKKNQEENIEELAEIIAEKQLYPVFQPIVSLRDGKVYGYEALSRISKPNTSLSISELFALAEKAGCVWELEKICRKKALKRSKRKPSGAKLFINVDGEVLQDRNFVEGFTGKKIKKYGLEAEDIVFEITERSDIENYKKLKAIIKHYKNQGYEIALDDVGAGYSGLNRIVNVSAEYMKLDNELVRDIDKKQTKQLIVGYLQQYCEELGMAMVAEGIETEGELQCLLRIGVPFGQGYFLGRPNEKFISISREAKDVMDEYNEKKHCMEERQ